MTLEQIADMLDAAERYGQWADRRDGPGLGAGAATGAPRAAPSDRYIRLSDSLAREISAALRQHARGESPRAVALERR